MQLLEFSLSHVESTSTLVPAATTLCLPTLVKYTQHAYDLINSLVNCSVKAKRQIRRHSDQIEILIDNLIKI